MKKRLKRVINLFYGDRYLIFRTQNKTYTLKISKYFFVSFCCFIICILVLSAYTITVFFVKKKALDNIYNEVSELRAVNTELAKYVDDVSSELSSFSGYITIPSKSKKISNKSGNNSHTIIVKEKIDLSKENIASFMIAMNARLASVVKQIQFTGLNPCDFVKESRQNLEKVKIAEHKNAKDDASATQKYDYAKKYYYFTSGLLSNGLASFTAKPVSMREEVDVLKKLESVLSVLPIGNPIRSSHRISSGYGQRRDPFNQGIRMHHGIDIVSNHGAKIYASGSGKVIFAGSRNGYGNTIEIYHGYGIKTRYAHLNKINVSVGQRVTNQDIIGHQGSTGQRCKGSHLHYELHYAGRPINPANFVYARRTQPVGSTLLASASFNRIN